MPLLTRLLALTLAAVLALPACAAERSAAAKGEFKRRNPCPATGERRGACPGYVIDHVRALACGGPDDPSNMQWQTSEESREKDRWERIGCKTGQNFPPVSLPLPPPEPTP